MNLSVFFLTFVMVVTLCATQEQETERPCNLAFKCSSTYYDPVWATTDNKTCEVYQNGCIFASSNCNRQNNYEPEAIDIGKEKCQALCKKCCPKDTKLIPICAYYNDEMRNFGSECEMDNYNCANGKSFRLYSEGMCKDSEYPVCEY